MLEITNTLRIPLDEIAWNYSRSGGPGGQNVNKVASKAQLRFPLATSPSVPEFVKARVRQLFPSRLTTDGELLVESQRTRDQEQNRDDCLRKFAVLLRQAATLPRTRRATKPTKSSKRRRLNDKKHNSTLKQSRRAPTDTP